MTIHWRKRVQRTVRCSARFFNAIAKRNWDRQGCVMVSDGCVIQELRATSNCLSISRNPVDVLLFWSMNFIVIWREFGVVIQ